MPLPWLCADRILLAADCSGDAGREGGGGNRLLRACDLDGLSGNGAGFGIGV